MATNADTFDTAAYDMFQHEITVVQRSAETCIPCLKRDAELIRDSNPVLYGMIQLICERTMTMHRQLSKLEAQMFADGLLSAAHADVPMPWLNHKGEWVSEYTPADWVTAMQCK